MFITYIKKSSSSGRIIAESNERKFLFISILENDSWEVHFFHWSSKVGFLFKTASKPEEQRVEESELLFVSPDEKCYYEVQLNEGKKQNDNDDNDLCEHSACSLLSIIMEWMYFRRLCFWRKLFSGLSIC